MVQKCKACGEEIEEDEEVECFECGTSICEYCALATYDNDDLYCQKCG